MATPEATPKVSLIVLNWNGADISSRCLEGIQATCNHSDGHEIILVDNGSTESGIAEVAATYPGVRLISHQTNLGFAGGMNLGVANARGDIVVIMNNDTAPHPGWLEPLVSALDNDPSCGMACPLIADEAGKVLHAGAYYDPRIDEYVHAYRGLPIEHGLIQSPRDCEVYIACVFAARKKDFDALGGFDDAYFQGYEDFDLCLKFRAAGLSIRYLPSSRITHFEGTSMTRLHRQQGKERFREVHKRNYQLFRSRWEMRFHEFRLPAPANAFSQLYDDERRSFSEFLPVGLGRTLDVGCSTGRLGMQLKEQRKADWVTGVDTDPLGIERAVTRLDEALLGDGEAIGSLLGNRPPFDSAILADVLEHLVNPWEFLYSLRTTLKPGGRVFASIPNIGYYKLAQRQLADTWKYEPQGLLDRTHIRFFGRSAIVRLFESAGFTIVRWGGEKKPTKWSRWFGKKYPRLEDWVTMQYFVEAEKRK